MAENKTKLEVIQETLSSRERYVINRALAGYISDMEGVVDKDLTDTARELQKAVFPDQD